MGIAFDQKVFSHMKIFSLKYTLFFFWYQQFFICSLCWKRETKTLKVKQQIMHYIDPTNMHAMTIDSNIHMHVWSSQ